MSCVTCGTSLPEGGTVCPVCEPWAIPAATAGASARSASPMPAPPASSDVPKWIVRLAKRHRPTNVGYQQLERAWRNTKVIASIGFVAYGASALACFFGFVVKVPAVAAICLVLALAGYIAEVCCLATIKQNYWIGRAVALAGAQPALGYAGLARIPAIAKITASLPAIRVLSVTIIVLRVFLTVDRALPEALRNGSWALYFVFFIAVTGRNVRLLGAAHKELARRFVAGR